MAIQTGKCMLLIGNEALSCSNGGQLSIQFHKNIRGSEGWIIERVNNGYTIKSGNPFCFNTYLSGNNMGALQTTKMKMMLDITFDIEKQNNNTYLIKHNRSKKYLTKDFQKRPILSNSKNGWNIQYLEKKKEQGPKIAVVTGSSDVGGLGFALCRYLVKTLPQGSTVYITGRNDDKNAVAKAEMKKQGYDCETFNLDFTKDESISKFMEKVKKVDIFIHNGNAFAVDARRDKTEKETEDEYKKYNDEYYKNVKQFLTVSHYGTLKICESIYQILNNNGRFVIVSSGFGLLKYQPSKIIREKCRNVKTIKEINELVREYLEDIKSNKEKGKWNNWCNPVAKMFQIMVCNVFALQAKNDERRKDIRFNSVNPGWTRTTAIINFLKTRPNIKTPGMREPKESARDIVDSVVYIDENTKNKNGDDIYINNKPMGFAIEPISENDEKEEKKKETDDNNEYELYYWKGFGGRLTVLQLILELGNAKYKVITNDNKLAQDIKGVDNKYYPNFAFPILKYGDFVMAQQPAIALYLGNKLNLIPKNENDKYQANSVMLLFCDLIREVSESIKLDKNSKEYQSKWNINKDNLGRFIKILNVLENQLKQNNNGKKWFFGDNICYVDCFAADIMKRFDMFLGKDDYEKLPVPLLKDLRKRFDEVDAIKKFLKSDKYICNEKRPWIY